MVCNTTPERKQRFGRDVGGSCLTALLFTLVCLCASPCYCSEQGVAWALQLSDLHLSVYNKHWLPQYGDKEGDLHLFADKVLPYIQPGAVIMGGDLVDAKTLSMRGHQYRQEWEDYRNILESFKKATGLPEEALLDVRGNHDAFDVPDRNQDWYTQYAAQGRRNSSSRVTVFPLHAPPEPGFLRTKKGCAAAVLVGLDVSPQPGLRGPTNFAGICGPALLQEMDAVLTAADTKFRADGCSPVFLAYGHHPLSTILHPDVPFWRQIDRTSPLTIYGKLSQHGIQAHVNGHLHSVFGQRLHMMHKSYAQGRLLELETAAWKDDRRFRLMTVDNGTFSFTDLMFNTPSKPVTKGVAPPPAPTTPDNITISGIDTHVVVSNFIVALTSPPDARYSPLTKPANGPASPSSFDTVRALVLPIATDAVATKVEVLWRCEEAKLEGSISMMRQKGPAPVYSAPWSTKVSCGPPKPKGTHVIMLQIIASEPDGQVSKSDVQQVALYTHKSGGSQLVVPRKPFPMTNKSLEKFMLWLDWTRTFNKLFMIQCFIHLVCMLLLPKALRKCITPDRPHIIPSTAHVTPAIQIPAKTQPAEADQSGTVDSVQGGAASRQTSHADVSTQGGLLSWVMWAPTVLCDMAGVPQIWWPQVLYSIYVPFGPWFAARFLSSQPLGLFLSQGVLLSPTAEASWQWLPCGDTLMLVNRFTFFTMLPGTLWLAGVVSHWERHDRLMAHSVDGLEAKSAKFKWTQLVTLGLLLAFHYQGLRILSHAYGYSCLILNPVMVWCMPCVFCLLVWLRYLRTPARADDMGRSKND